MPSKIMTIMQTHEKMGGKKCEKCAGGRRV
jgi:hypothetical protein